ncbi:lysosomal acid glucosylceramidase-like [Mya arenaria]|uniref:lysosomal acid glucosylceramidase-like n=1 Tax=Mya arenaria TaxID=6604 RepID=UPI0022DF69B2|nr:lysosomal acid glucosylceramidase-like [Mya arenaria]XP_052774447.1 lysosomal acid glucosylceramidase-like [Mya arenaria]XP_052774448.1 lysosomal acid glucosylceramidase-like [Mya arenaria]
MKTLHALSLATFFLSAKADDIPCMARWFDQDSVVCVCNSTYCDTITWDTSIPPPVNPYGYYYSFTSSRDGLRLKMKQGSFGDSSVPNKYAFYAGNETKQTIMGFGGAFTDAATMTMYSLSDAARNKLIDSYFSNKGINYNIGRIPMASCDFSKRVYSYDDVVGDLQLSNFSLAEEDFKFKIPAIKDAITARGGNISLFGSPWSAPAWMKSNNKMTGKGTLKVTPKREYFKAWAKYFVKFLQAYRDQGVDIWGLTAQNEPSDGLITNFPFQCMGWTPEMQRDFVAQDLGPALEASGFGHIKLMILDDDRLWLPYWPEVVLKDKNAAKYVSGIAVHWYEDLFVPTSALDLTYKQFGEDYFILNTEACEQDLINKNRSVLLGSWHRGERYFMDILKDLSHGVSGWVDWNLALDRRGGPNWQNNLADSPIIVNAEKDEFYKQPMFYAMAHFSKFVKPGAKILSFSKNFTEDIGVEAIFFTKESEQRVGANFVNTNDNETVSISIFDPPNVGMINFDLPPRSFVTFSWFRW